MGDIERQRRQVFYSGRVQGVGFRFTARSLAADFAITGYVRNLRDGRVELVAEGPAEEVAGFLTEIRTTLARHIRDIEECPTPPAGPLGGFEVRY